VFFIAPEQETALKILLREFLAENTKLNLSALRTEKDCWIGNILDSLAFLELESQLPTVHCQFLDMGTGGGFPLLPLAITLPKCTFTGIDATQKKVDAVERILEQLNCSNCRIICSRIEKIAQYPQHRAQYDIVLARGVAPIHVLLEYGAAFVKKGGHLVFWKSMHIEEELTDSLTARSLLHCQLVSRHEYELPEGFGKRQLLIFEKMENTPEEYPRKVGVPAKKPIV